jgi:hypothetical protein
MDFGNTGQTILFVAVIIGLLLLQFVFRRRRSPATTQQQIVQSLLAEVRFNLRLAEVLSLNWQAKKFITTGWQIDKNKLDFLEQSLQSTLSDAFAIAEDFNQQLVVAKKYKSSSYMANIDMAKLKEKLTKSREGLEEWLLSKTGTKEPSTKPPSMTDILFGGRR